MRTPKEPGPFPSEADLCAAFSAEMVRQGWTPYPETSDWDILLVGHGMQVGVEAKLKPSIAVLAQLASRIGNSWQNAGPQYAVVLVPTATSDFEAVARAVGGIVVHPSYRSPTWMTAPSPGETRAVWPKLLPYLEHAPALHFEAPAWVPDIMPDVAAGVPSPVRLTAWKLLALRLVARLEIRGYVTIADFRDLGLHNSRWYHHWLVPEGNDRPQRWVRRPDVALADAQHPAAFASVIEQERSRLMREVREAVAG